ncbi:MAG: hypothetical protein Q7R52_02955 [archaeon]|nr:hypothetical protein [archaeon]
MPKPESIKHKILKEKIYQYFKEKGYDVYKEYIIDRKIIDVVAIKETEKILIECIAKKGINETFNKLMKLKEKYPTLNCIICRFFKERNPISNKIINNIKSNGIQFIEFNDIDIIDIISYK